MQTLGLGIVDGETVPAFWDRLAQASQEWLRAQGLSARDAVLLVPFAQHLVPARRAFARRGGWSPRIETTRSLATALGPTPLARPGEISGDAAIDRFTAQSLLASQSWAQALAERDPAGFRTGVARLVETAHTLLRGAQQRPLAERPTWFAAVRDRLQVGGPGELERALALVALAWAESDGRRPATDALFNLRPSAWLVLRAGGPDPLAEALLASGPPALRLDAELDLDAPGSIVARTELALSPDFEALAAQAATAVIQHLNAGRVPVALLAQDRVVLRRVQALLARQGVPVHDETGWTLATTPAAAALMALLRAVLSPAGLDEWLAWMKSPLGSAWPAAELRHLESLCRRKGWSQPARLDPLELPAWQRAREAVAPLGGGPRRLAEWLGDLGRVLNRLGPLEAVDGGATLLEALWISRNPWAGSAHEAVIGAARLRPDEFLAWVDATLEAEQFRPDEDAVAQVVVTPMARALLRPFGAVVLPGADIAGLAPPTPGPGLLADADAAALGLPHAAAEREAQALAFAQTLRAPVLTLLRCTQAGSEPLAPSPLLTRLEAARGAPLPAWVDERVAEVASSQPSTRRAARPARLPASLSPSSIDALRHCPYQFFARSLLGLGEVEELEAELEKRDYGDWLHAVLRRFHESDRSGGDEAALRAAAEAESTRLDAAEFLPFAVAFERLVPRYLTWLQAVEAEGQHFEAGEVDVALQPFAPPLHDLTLKGRIDRIDQRGGTRWLLDYKTGSADQLKATLKLPLEDTQLAAYALLQGAGPDLAAAYLALDEPKAIITVEHPKVSETAQALGEGLQADLTAVLNGEELPALGEGRLCDHCAARGLCRKDDWS